MPTLPNNRRLDPPSLNIHGSMSPKKKKSTVSLSRVGSFLLGIYLVFVYFIMIAFRNDNETTTTTAPGNLGNANLRSGGSAPDNIISAPVSIDKINVANSKIVEQSSKKDANAKKVDPPSTIQKTVPKASSKNGDELQSILSGSIISHAKEIEFDNISSPHGGVGKNEQGLRDRRNAEDIVVSVLTAAKHGDRQYESESMQAKAETISTEAGGRTPEMPILTAHCEPVDQTTWSTKPLPVRPGPATKSSLFSISYPHVNSCKALPSQWPIDTPPVDLDPFLPWIHDVFPSSDGKNVVFVAQNRRRCYNGQRYLANGEKVPDGVIAHKNSIHLEYGKNYFMRPQASLFQHVPVKKISVSEKEGDIGAVDEVSSSSVGEEPRYRLSSHEEADPDGMDTRFICRFKAFDPNTTPNLSIVGYSLSEFEVDYDYHTYRKGYLRTHTEAGYDNHMIWTSQLLFKCPIPETMHDKVRRGDTVDHDYSTLYVDIIPIRTPPRYTPPREFFQPKFGFSKSTNTENAFDADIEWGKDHVLPKIDESGRWENIPVCMPSLMTAEIVPKGADINTLAIPDKTGNHVAKKADEVSPVIHEVIACTWASTTFKTRSNRASVGDGKRRLKEWLEFNLLSGFNHIYVYDNSGAFTNEDSLADVIELFPSDKVTRVDWPCKICSNRDGNEGERSSQYAAESSCRLRFGAHARWLGSFDTDEYLVPMGNFSSMGEVASDLDKRGVRVAVFPSSPSKPRFDLIDDPKKTEEGDMFTPTVTEDETFLNTYNCNWEQFPRKNTLTHRSKQMYRADYVKLHYVHYATITAVSQMSEEETKKSGENWMHRYKEHHMHEFDEQNEATMLHTKSKVAHNMRGWTNRCKQSLLEESHCNVGFPFPKDFKEGSNSIRNDGWAYNCFLNEKIESYWSPRLVAAIKERG